MSSRPPSAITTKPSPLITLSELVTAVRDSSGTKDGRDAVAAPAAASPAPPAATAMSASARK